MNSTRLRNPVHARNDVNDRGIRISDAAVRRMVVSVERAKPGDEGAIEHLLREAGLPHHDIAVHIPGFFVARAEHGAVLGAVAMERFGEDALLRSLVVGADAQRGGIAGQLIARIEIEAQSAGVRRWWLLTTTAADYFRRRGFKDVPRGAAPPSIQHTAQFSGVCGCDAVCLTRRLGTAASVGGAKRDQG